MMNNRNQQKDTGRPHSSKGATMETSWSKPISVKKNMILLSVLTIIPLFTILYSVITTEETSRIESTRAVRFAGPDPIGSTGVRFSGNKVRTFVPPKGSSLSLVPLASSLENRPFNKNDLIEATAEKTNGRDTSSCQKKQWAVVTTIHVPNPSIIGVANLRNWCLVIVGDTITPDSEYDDLATKENVFYLSALDQKEMFTPEKSQSKRGMSSARNKANRNQQYQFTEMMPFKSFARKNIGYLFAINHGAQVIYDFDDDNVLVPLEDGETIPPPFHHDDNNGADRTILLKSVVEKEETATFTTAFNPYIYMGPSHKNSWPRGFPIDKLADNFEIDVEKSEIQVGDLPLSSIGVIQSLCNGDPDTDAVFRMTRKDSTKFTFDRSVQSMPLLVPFNAYSPYNAQATTHLYNAFWGLYLPITVPGRVTDIWRSYITQRIMKDIGLHVLYTPPIVNHNRSAHDYLSDLAAERDLYDKTTKLLDYIDSWSSDADTLPERILALWVGLYEHDYLGEQDVHAAREWLNALTASGYKFPSVVINSDHVNALTAANSIQFQPAVEGQPYRAYPYFNVDRDGKTFVQSDENELQKWLSNVDWESRPESVVVKLILMTMDEWPLLKSWVMVSTSNSSLFLCCSVIVFLSYYYFTAARASLCSHNFY